MKVWRYGLWDTHEVRVLLTVGVAFFLTVPLVIKHNPAFFKKNYNTFMLVSRCFKISLIVCLQHSTITLSAGQFAPGFTQDVIITSLVEVLLLLPLVDPMFFIPNISTQLFTLAAATSRNRATYMAAYAATSPLVGVVSRLPFAPSLSSLHGFPEKAIGSGVFCGHVDGVVCSSVLGHLQLHVCAVGLVLSMLFEVKRRRAFLRANLRVLGRNAAWEALLWPLGDIKGFATCTTVLVGVIQGYLLLAELVVRG